MSTPYTESYGNDNYDDKDWFYTGMKYDWDTHLWVCSCNDFTYSGRCKHAYRIRDEVTVIVNEDYL